jgi:hypothetical protein
MQVTFEQRPDWVIEADLGPAFEGFNDTLHDAVSSLPPRGSSEDCPSPYWIDRALEGLAKKPADPSRPFLWGNATELCTDGNKVRAHSQYELFPDEVMPVADFVDVLRNGAPPSTRPGEKDVVGRATNGTRVTPGRHEDFRFVRCRTLPGTLPCTDHR